MPGPTSPDAPVRCKSYGHHTAGFDNRDEAVESAKQTAAAASISRLQLDKDILWDGTELTCMVGFIQDDKLVFLNGQISVGW